MFGFHALKIVQSPGVNVIDCFSDTFSIGNDRDTFLMTVSKLWIKEYTTPKSTTVAEEAFSQSLFAFVLSKIRSGDASSDPVFLAQVEFLVKFYASIDQRRADAEKPAPATKAQSLAVILSAIYGIMQNPKASAETKNKCAQYLVQLVNLDHSAFKELAQSAPAGSSICYLSA